MVMDAKESRIRHSATTVWIVHTAIYKSHGTSSSLEASNSFSIQRHAWEGLASGYSRVHRGRAPEGSMPLASRI